MTTTPTRRRPEWPVQLRLPGQTAAHEGPVDMHMMYVMHHAFRRDLAAFAAAAAVTPSADRDTWQALARRWELFSTALHHHHAGEDAGLWPRLLEVADEQDRATLEAMEAVRSLETRRRIEVGPVADADPGHLGEHGPKLAVSRPSPVVRSPRSVDPIGSSGGRRAGRSRTRSRRRSCRGARPTRRR